MTIIKYLLSKNWRFKVDSEYTEELCDKYETEQKHLEETYKILNENITKKTKSIA